MKKKKFYVLAFILFLLIVGIIFELRYCNGIKYTKSSFLHTSPVSIHSENGKLSYEYTLEDESGKVNIPEMNVPYTFTLKNTGNIPLQYLVNFNGTVYNTLSKYYMIKVDPDEANKNIISYSSSSFIISKKGTLPYIFKGIHLDPDQSNSWEITFDDEMTRNPKVVISDKKATIKMNLIVSQD